MFVFDWLFFVLGFGGRIMTWVPEILSILVALTLPFRTSVEKDVHIPLKYGILIAFYLLHLMFGLFLNDVKPWTMLAGLRVYTKFIPIFLFPIIFPLRQRVFRNLLLWIYALALVQLPVVLWQGFVRYSALRTGDRLGGTLGISTTGVLAIFLTTVMSFLIAFYYKELISFPMLIFSIILTFIPITMNETKITVILLPVAFIFPAIFLKAKRDAIFKVMLTILLLVVFGAMFKTGYDYFSKRQGRNITLMGFFTDDYRLKKYNKHRWGPLRTAITVAPKGDMRFAIFGRGAGNVSEGFTPILSGKYLQEMYQYDVVMTFPQLMWELGYLGTLLFFLFPVFTFFDAIKVGRQEGIAGAYGLGMLTFSVFFSMVHLLYPYN